VVIKEITLKRELCFPIRMDQVFDELGKLLSLSYHTRGFKLGMEFGNLFTKPEHDARFCGRDLDERLAEIDPGEMDHEQKELAISYLKIVFNIAYEQSDDFFNLGRGHESDDFIRRSSGYFGMAKDYLDVLLTLLEHDLENAEPEYTYKAQQSLEKVEGMKKKVDLSEQAIQIFIKFPDNAERIYELWDNLVDATEKGQYETAVQLRKSMLAIEPEYDMWPLPEKYEEDQAGQIAIRFPDSAEKIFPLLDKLNGAIKGEQYEAAIELRESILAIEPEYDIWPLQEKYEDAEEEQTAQISNRFPDNAKRIIPLLGKLNDAIQGEEYDAAAQFRNDILSIEPKYDMWPKPSS